MRTAHSLCQGRRIAITTVAVAGVMCATAAARASAGVVALWHMDESSGTSMLDSAGKQVLYLADQDFVFTVELYLGFLAPTPKILRAR